MGILPWVWYGGEQLVSSSIDLRFFGELVPKNPGILLNTISATVVLEIMVDSTATVSFTSLGTSNSAASITPIDLGDFDLISVGIPLSAQLPGRFVGTRELKRYSIARAGTVTGNFSNPAGTYPISEVIQTTIESTEDLRFIALRAYVENISFANLGGTADMQVTVNDSPFFTARGSGIATHRDTDPVDGITWTASIQSTLASGNNSFSTLFFDPNATVPNSDWPIFILPTS